MKAFLIVVPFLRFETALNRDRTQPSPLRRTSKPSFPSCSIIAAQINQLVLKIREFSVLRLLFFLLRDSFVKERVSPGPQGLQVSLEFIHTRALQIRSVDSGML